ncbi:MAG TPA: Nif3-like dinuclear metal center hexameric protein [Patescibacteria group bacterium]|nr:Nif3-like dinuclear metal center hexameric protein [Patescibacteria group bacterium]
MQNSIPLRDFLDIIERELPHGTAMEGDRLGLQIQSGRTEISSVLVCLDVTDEVILEARTIGCDCIVTFHPLLFAPMFSIAESDRIGRLTAELIRQNIALVSIHTNFDAFSQGTSEILAEKLGLDVTGVLIPDPNYEGRGVGAVAVAREAIRPEEFLQRVSAVCLAPLRFSEPVSEFIEKIVIVGGSGSDFLKDVLKSGADAFITADVKYHTFHRASGHVMLIDAGHYETEQFVPEGITGLLKNLFSEWRINFSTTRTLTNPVRYYP